MECSETSRVMQLGRFHAFTEKLRVAVRADSKSPGVEVYRSLSGDWTDASGQTVLDRSMVNTLQVTFAKGEPWRERSSPTAYIPLRELDAVVVATFSAPPRKETTARFSHRVRECLEHAKNAFDATHDGLTGLLNKTEFDQRLTELLVRASPPPALAEATIDLTGAASTIAVLAMDLDLFKQLNDTHGHLYGDMVLQCFASRIERKLAELGYGSEQAVGALVGRTGGEEFSVVLSGPLSKEQIEEVAEQLLLGVSEQPMPSDEEWCRFEMQAKAASLAQPHVSERRVTVSIGVASCSPPGDRNDAKRVASRLVGQADTALYRAKAGGRNTVRHFNDILARHGRILEHHADTGIVAIDIGKQVNVAVGQEFLVFHPNFDGNTPFIFSDGRTRKRMGSYPRLSCGRIVAFDVQQEISFCRVRQPDQAEYRFAGGALLEAVPVGSIAHLISDQAFGGLSGPELATVEELTRAVHTIAKVGEWPFVAVLRIKDLPEIAEQRGSAFVNHALAQLFGAIRQEFVDAKAIGQIQATEFAVICAPTPANEAVPALGRVLRKASDRCSSLVSFIAGAYLAPDPIAKDTAMQSLDHSSGLDFARYAASAEGRSNDAVTVFSSHTAVQMLITLRSNQKFTQALADYRKLVALGIRSAPLENQAALCAFAMMPSDLEVARESLSRAISIDSETGIYHANLGIVEFRAGRRSIALGHFLNASINDPKFKMAEQYYGAFALSALAGHQEDATGVPAAAVLDLIQKALKAPDSMMLTNKAELENALQIVTAETANG